MRLYREPSFLVSRGMEKFLFKCPVILGSTPICAYDGYEKCAECVHDREKEGKREFFLPAFGIIFFLPTAKATK